jgi:hypothetical protein
MTRSEAAGSNAMATSRACSGKWTASSGQLQTAWIDTDYLSTRNH